METLHPPNDPDATRRDIVDALSGPSTCPNDEDQSEPTSIAPEGRMLSAERVADLLSTLKSRLSQNPRLSECDWGMIEQALQKDPEALWSVNEMEKQGHKPSIYNFDANGFDIGTCSLSVPESTENHLYSAAARTHTDKCGRKLSDSIRGAAVEKATAMGLRLMSDVQYCILQGVLKPGATSVGGPYEERMSEYQKFDTGPSACWILTEQDKLNEGEAWYGFRRSEGLVVVQASALANLFGWRGTRRVMRKAD